MKDPKLKVVRFTAQDVIATSGTAPYAVTGAIINAWKGSTTYNNPENGLDFQFNLNSYDSGKTYQNDALYEISYDTATGLTKGTGDIYEVYTFDLGSEVTAFSEDCYGDGANEDLTHQSDFVYWLSYKLVGPT